MKTLLLILALSCNLNALTLGEIRTDVRSLITDGQGTRQRFSDSELNNWINEGQRVTDAATLCTYKKLTFDLQIGVTYYNLPSDFLDIIRVTRTFLSLQELTPAGLDGRSAEWENQSGLPTYYFINFSSRTRIGFAPFPMLSSDTETIRVEYRAYNPTMTSDSDIPFGGIVEFFPFHYSLTYYAAFKASMVDERDNKSKVFMESYTSMNKLMKDQCISRPNYRPQMIGKQ